MSPLIFIPNIRPAASAPNKTTTLPGPLVMKFQMHEQLRLICIIHKCLILVGNGTEYSYSCSLSQYTIYGASHSSMSCLNVSSSVPPTPLQIEVWAVSNLTFVLMSVTILLLSTTEVPFKVLALYSLPSGTLNALTATPRVLYAGWAKICLKHYMPFQTLYITRNY